MVKIAFFLMTQKGYTALQAFVQTFGTGYLACVVCAHDPNVDNDYYEEIRGFCQSNNISFMSRRNFEECGASHYFAISWKWILDIKTGTLIVLHDSLLPKYRGFNPLVSALINGDKQIGVTALFAGKEFDVGDIIAQKSADITYPIRIQRAIDIISDLYSELVNKIAAQILAGKELAAYEQDLSQVTYSLWRDEMDYLIDWNRSADYIKRFIDSVGVPYKGASSYIDRIKVRILDSEVVDDVDIVNRTPGKILFKRDKYPIVVCGKGLLKILELVDDEHRWDMLRDLKFRIRFRSSVYPQ